jgi:thiamine pyrophosphate-dependent acetolactate synthase large subunit-like protein
LLQITASPEVASAARMRDSLISDSKLAIDRLLELVDDGSARTAPETFVRTRQLPGLPATPPEVYAAPSKVKPSAAVIVSESTSTMEQQLEWLPTVKPDSWFFTPSGGLGWGIPATAGIALGAQHKLPIVYVIMRNGEYSVLKAFARLEETPGVPGLDLPGLDIASLARGFGCHTAGHFRVGATRPSAAVSYATCAAARVGGLPHLGSARTARHGGHRGQPGKLRRRGRPRPARARPLGGVAAAIRQERGLIATSVIAD